MLYLKTIILFTAVFYVGFCRAGTEAKTMHYYLTCDAEYCCDKRYYNCETITDKYGSESWEAFGGDKGPQEVPIATGNALTTPFPGNTQIHGKAMFITDCGDNSKPISQHHGHSSNKGSVTCVDGPPDEKGHWKCVNTNIKKAEKAYIKHARCSR